MNFFSLLVYMWGVEGVTNCPKGATFTNLFLKWCYFKTNSSMGLFCYVKCMQLQRNCQPHWRVCPRCDTWLGFATPIGDLACNGSSQFDWRFAHAFSDDGYSQSYWRDQGYSQCYWRDQRYSQWCWRDHAASNSSFCHTLLCVFKIACIFKIVCSTFFWKLVNLSFFKFKVSQS